MKHLFPFLAVGLAAASAVAGALAERQSKARALMREADSLSREGKVQEAMDKFYAALALHPEALVVTHIFRPAR